MLLGLSYWAYYVIHTEQCACTGTCMQIMSERQERDEILPLYLHNQISSIVGTCTGKIQFQLQAQAYF